MATGNSKRGSQGDGSAAQRSSGDRTQSRDMADERRPGGGSGGGQGNRQGKQVNKGGPLSDVQRGLKNVAPGNEAEHEGATEAQVGERGGPGVGFDQEPKREKDEGGVS
jgi:hypothetical protein